VTDAPESHSNSNVDKKRPGLFRKLLDFLGLGSGHGPRRSSTVLLLSLSAFGSAALNLLPGIFAIPSIPGAADALRFNVVIGATIGLVALVYWFVNKPDYATRSRPFGVTFLAVETILIGLVSISEGVFLLFMPVVGIIGVIIAGLGLGFFKLGKGLWDGKEWSREIMLVLSAIGIIISFVLEFAGLGNPILAIYQLWYLRRPYAANYFRLAYAVTPEVAKEGIFPEDSLVRVEDVHVHFPVKVPFIQRLISREESVVHAVDGVSFELRTGEILGLVGESGCGKTTVGRAIVRLVNPTSGRIIFEGRNITHTPDSELRPMRRRMQIIFQDPSASLNPAMTIGQAIGHPLWIHGLVTSKEEARKTVLNIMGEVGLTPETQLYDKYPADLSGGQKQRAVIARALILGPRLLVVDEGVAMLDMSIRAKVLQLMLDLKRAFGLTYLFITHDLATAKLICDRIAIMYLGRIVEIGSSSEIYRDPKHPYTQALLQVIPVPDPDKRRKKILPRGEVPDAVNLPAGCRYHPRCTAVLSSCGWEGRDFIDLLDEHLSGITRAVEDVEALGPIEDWWAKGLLAGRNVGTQDPQRLVEKVRAVLAKATPPMQQAVQSVAVQGESVIVQFRIPEQLRQTVVADRTVECLLYQ